MSLYAAWLRRLQQILKFALVSGIGLGIDFVIFLLLMAGGFAPFTANIVSGACAVTFVYFASVRKIFSYAGRFLLGLFLAYLAYQAAGVTLASLAVGYLATLTSPVLAKILILPVTFGANYLFMLLLTRSGRNPPAAAVGTADQR
jgi:putative flippase GtrA